MSLLLYLHLYVLVDCLLPVPSTDVLHTTWLLVPEQLKSTFNS